MRVESGWHVAFCCNLLPCTGAADAGEQGRRRCVIRGGRDAAMIRPNAYEVPLLRSCTQTSYSQHPAAVISFQSDHRVAEESRAIACEELPSAAWATAAGGTGRLQVENKGFSEYGRGGGAATVIHDALAAAAAAAIVERDDRTCAVSSSGKSVA